MGFRFQAEVNVVTKQEPVTDGNQVTRHDVVDVNIDTFLIVTRTRPVFAGNRDLHRRHEILKSIVMYTETKP